MVEHGDTLDSSVAGALRRTVRRDLMALEVLATKPATPPAVAAVQNRRKGPSWWKRATVRFGDLVVIPEI